MTLFRRDKDKKKRRRRSSRSSTGERRDRRREDTRDRDARRREKSRSRTVAKEQQEVFGAINFDDEPLELDEIDHTFGRILSIALYLMLGLLVTGVAIYAVGRGVEARRAAQVVPLQTAAAEGDLSVLRALATEDAPINEPGPDGGTALQSAIRAGQLDATRLLLDHGARPSSDAIRTAMRYKRWDILNALILAGGDPEVRGEWSGRSPLELAVEREDVETVRLLLDSGADPGAISNEGPAAQPALHYAAQHDMRDVVELLLQHGADPGRMWMGYLPRHLAADAGHDEVAALLAEAEVSPDSANAGLSE